MCTMYDCVYRKTAKKCSNYLVKPCKATLVVVSQLTQVCRLVARQQGLWSSGEHPVIINQVMQLLQECIPVYISFGLWSSKITQMMDKFLTLATITYACLVVLSPPTPCLFLTEFSHVHSKEWTTLGMLRLLYVCSSYLYCPQKKLKSSISTQYSVHV